MRGLHSIFIGVAGLAAVGANAANLATTPRCAPDKAAFRSMLESEYAFAQKARASVRDAFLEYLAEDSLVLQPGPKPGRAVYTAAKASTAQLQWYPAIADIAASGDLGFTTGPWVYTGASGAKATGHFLTVWQRDAACRWSVLLDGGIENAEPAANEPKLVPDQIAYSAPELPPQRFISDDAPGNAISDFQAAASQAGFAGALRTYGRNGDFLFYTDQHFPMGIAAATVYLAAHEVTGTWKQAARGRAADSTLLYTVGEIVNTQGQNTHVYEQIWQYDPKVSNWGLRILMINPLPPPK
jgi:ketosteroid isomerase-like protein